MKLQNAAHHFDKMPVYDAYTGTKLFNAQIGPYDDSKRDALNVLRRIISTRADSLPPTRRAVRTVDRENGDVWILGLANHDVFLRERIRAKWIAQRAHGLFSIRTPAQAIAGTGGTAAYAGLAWLKDWKDPEYGSRTFPYYEIYFAPGEPVEPGSYLVVGTQTFRVRGTYSAESLMLVAECDELPATRQLVTLVTKASYSPTTDSTATTSASVPALVMRFMVNYEFQQESAPKREEGDMVVLIDKSDQPTAPVGSTVYINGRSYRTLSAVSEADAWRLHVRP